MAGSISGEPRSTLDIDLVVQMTEADVEPLVAALGKGFHADAVSLRRAIRERSSSNLIHLQSSTKVDLFIAGASPLDAGQMDRRQRVQVAADPNRHLFFYTPEDILLQKLRWYRMENEVSDRQWRDILGILIVQRGRLDEAYLQRRAEALDVTDLLARSLALIR
jgi:hypothetical protein